MPSPQNLIYYAKLITAWNAATSPPAGVTGAPLTAGMTTDQKIAAVNGWTVPNPQDAIVTGGQILAVMDKTEYPSFSPSQLSALSPFFAVQSVDLSPVNGNAREIVQGILTPWPLSLAGFNALLAPFDNATKPWLATILNISVISENDTVAAGLV